MICCGVEHSIALTQNGRVFCWGSSPSLDYYHCPLSYKPKLVSIDIPIKNMCCYEEYSLLLAINGDVYKILGRWGWRSPFQALELIKLIYENKFIDMAAHRNYSYTALLLEKNFYFVWNTGLEKAVTTKFKSFVEIFSYYSGITYRKVDRLDESVKSLSLPRNKKYEQNFKEMHLISSGFFGIFCKAETKNSSEIFAFKKIP